MLHTSIGFHTFTVFHVLTANEAMSLLKDFYRNMETNGNIIIIDKDKRHKQYDIIYKTYVGIRWRLRFYNQSADYKSYIVEATINPKIIVGTNDYIMAATEDYIEKTSALFNIEARKISSYLAEFTSYKLSRIDYCINFCLGELGIEVGPAIIMELIKRANIPRRFNERLEYDKAAHRRKPYKNSLYLENESVVINCYWKGQQLEEYFSNCPDINNASDVIRFEVQCKYKKVHSMSHKNHSSLSGAGIIFDMFSDIKSCEVISNYYNEIVGGGDYYSLKRAKEIVKSHNFKDKKENRLIDTLSLINKCRGIPKTRTKLSTQKQQELGKTLKELARIGINPVTIPKRFNADHIPNLLTTYFELC